MVGILKRGVLKTAVLMFWGIALAGCEKTFPTEASQRSNGAGWADRAETPRRDFVEIIELERPEDPVVQKRVAFGRIVAARRRELSFGREGIVSQIDVRPGQRVDLDQPLARLDVSTLQQQRQERIAAGNQLQREMRASARTPPQASLEQLDAYAAEVKQIDLLIANSVLTAPFAGTVDSLSIRVGQAVRSDQPVGGLVDDSRFAVRARLPADSINDIDDSEFSTVIDGRSYGLRLSEGDDGAVPRTFEFIMMPGEAEVGKVVRLDITWPVPEDHWWLPAEAVISRWDHSAEVVGSSAAPSNAVPPTTTERSWMVYVVEEDDAGTRSLVRSCPLDSVLFQGGRVLVRGPLNVGDWIIHGGTHRVLDGQSVTPLVEPSTAADDSLLTPASIRKSSSAPSRRWVSR